MRKVIAALNMTLDGYCDHTSGIADDEIHDHYTGLISGADDIIYGRKTYQLMEDYWPALVKKPSGNKAADDFAVAMDKIRKLVFSRTLKSLNWSTARLAKKTVAEEIRALKQQSGREILVGSPSLIVETINLGLADELQICVHPIIAVNGLPLFKNIAEPLQMKLIKTKIFGCGSVLFYYDLKLPVAYDSVLDSF